MLENFNAKKTEFVSNTADEESWLTKLSKASIGNLKIGKMSEKSFFSIGKGENIQGVPLNCCLHNSLTL